MSCDSLHAKRLTQITVDNRAPVDRASDSMMVHRGSTDDLRLLKISSGVVWQTRDLHLTRNTLYLLSPRLCFFIVLTRT